MKKIFYIISILTLMILSISGCGKQTKEGIAKEFIESINDLDFKKAQNLSTFNAKVKNSLLLSYCNSNKYNFYVISSTLTLAEIQRTSKYFPLSKVKGFTAALKESKLKSILDKDFILSNDNIKKLIEFTQKFYKQDLDGIYSKVTKSASVYKKDNFKKDLPNPDIVKKIIAYYYLVNNNSFGFSNYNFDELQKATAFVIALYGADGFKLTKECIKKYSPFGDIDKIGEIKVKQSIKNGLDKNYELSVPVIYDNGDKDNIDIELYRNGKTDKLLIENWYPLGRPNNMFEPY